MGNDVLCVGIDVGSTTVKTVVVTDTSRILWKRYDRHETRQAEVLRDQLGQVQGRFPDADWKFYITGSGAGAMADVVGATFIQEVNAVEMAVDTLLPGTGSVIELGGQDAKIIVWKTDGAGHRRSAITMNDKCAGGTGATIDRILLKTGLDPHQASRLPFSGERIHRIAARCGVFAETDVVCLLKMGIPESEIVPSLFTAIVKQNLEVLTRGNVLRERVALLGGPNRFFPALVDCWRLHIPIHWQERGHRPTEASLEDLIFCPADAEYYAALGSVLYGRYEEEFTPGRGEATRGCPLSQLDGYITQGRETKLARSGKTRPALVKDEREKVEFLEAYGRAPEPPPDPPERDMDAYLGIDGGSTSTKAVLVDEDGNLVARAYALSAGNPLEDTRRILGQLKRERGDRVRVRGAGATGYAGKILDRALGLDSFVVETVAHMLSAQRYYDNVDVICDVGGQDIKIIFLKDGLIKDFRFNTQCSAGNGYFLQSMATQLDVPLEDFAERAFRARIAPAFHYGCAVFMEQDKVNLQQLGYNADEMLAGLARVLPLNIWQYIAQVHDLGSCGRRFVLQGGTQKNLAAVKAQVDYITQRVPDAEVIVHRYAAESGAIGAAMEACRQVQRRGSSTFIGLEEACQLEFSSRNDETTRCTFCNNGCHRTFIDSRTPSGQVFRYISGHSCEKGSVQTRERMKEVVRRTRRTSSTVPNLVQEAFTRAFSIHPCRPYGPGARSSTWEMRQRMKVGIPRALTQHHSAPFFSTFLGALGVGEVVFSSETSDRLWERGGKWGTIDPCFPAKVANAHVFDLLERKDLDAIFFPMVECLPSSLTGVKGNWACTIQTATPEVVRACFTKEKDRFAQAHTKYFKPLVNLERPRECEQELFNYFQHRLGVTRQEVAHAVGEGYRVLHQYRQELREEGRRIIERARRDGGMVLVMLGRPYHNDPGLNHSILRKFQLRGYPIIGIEALPVDPDFLDPLFDPEDREQMLGVEDVWKRAYNYGGNQKLWAAKVVARHPHLAAVELASFKCGYDYSISGYLERIAETARSPYFMFHDLDQNRSESALDLRIESICYFLDQIRERMGKQQQGHPVRGTEARA